MAKITFKGLDTYMEQLERLGKESEKIAVEAAKKGAGILADEVRAGINWLDPESESEVTRYELERREKQIQGLKDSMGISPEQNDKGFINVKVGFDGYNTVKTKKFPKGQPNPMVARIFNSGTSSMHKQPFFDHAEMRARMRVRLKMKEVFESEIEKIMKE